DWQKLHTNILQMRDQIGQFLKYVGYEDRQPALKDIDNMLNEDRLVFVSVNGNTLNDKPGYISHALLVIAREEDDYIVHDPGLPPVPYRHIPASLLQKAMGTDAEVTGFKLRL